jgi:hypothetical protein
MNPEPALPLSGDSDDTSSENTARGLPLLPASGDWMPEILVDRSPRSAAHRRLRAEIAANHAASVAAYADLVALRDADFMAIIRKKPQFMELARTFAAAFADLTESVDTAMQTGVAWRDLITNARTLRALDIGIERCRRYEILLFLQRSGKLDELLH